MGTIAAVILGIIQGLTEFLPISSSAHLILVPWFFGWDHEGLTFDVALHLGTAFAVLAYFWKDWCRLVKAFWIGLKFRNPFGSEHGRLAWFILIGTIPAAVIGFLFEDLVETELRSPLITIFTLVAFGALLFWADKKGRKKRNIEEYNWKDCLWIGFSQALALIPGVSRSGITMTTAMFRHSSRTSAARFSFLLSTPIIVGAGILKAWRWVGALESGETGRLPVEWTVLLAGTISAAITGFLCIRYFLRYLRQRSFTPFVVYRFILAGVVLMMYLKYS
jgi:undecaprenyl-diphosphatase